MAAIDAVQVPHEIAHAGMERRAEEMPVELGIEIPLAALRKFLAHEDELLAGMRPHEAVEGPEIGELLPVVARHLAEHRALAVHHLVMAERQHEILGEGVEQAEGQLVVMESAEHGIERHVVERVVHPAHVPLEAEAEAAFMRGARDARPGGRLLGDRHRAGMLAISQLVGGLQETDRLVVLVAAIGIGQPLARLAGIIEIEHRGDGIDAQTVDMVAVEPVERAGGEEVSHLTTAEIIDGRVPVGMEAAARIGIFIERPAIEMGEAVLVGREMRRHPVEDNAETGLMGAIDEAGEAGRIAMARRRREESDRLIAPGRVERMLGDRQEFEMGEAEIGGIGDQPVGDLVPVHEAPAIGLLP